jgi:RES domain-containing protein
MRTACPIAYSREMRLWRLTQSDHTALDGGGASRYGSRYSPEGAPVVNFASEPGLAVLIALRYLPSERFTVDPGDYVLGWTQVDAVPERAGGGRNDAEVRDWVAEWLNSHRSLLAAVESRVLPEADVILMNPLHEEAQRIPPLSVRPFSFAECLHTPPMLAKYTDHGSAGPGR